MKLITRSPRRMIMTAAVAGAAILLPAIALASSGTATSSSTGTSSSRSSANAAAATPSCHRVNLRAWLAIPAGITNATNFYDLEISNISGHACTLYGFPGVSATRANGRQLGSAAMRRVDFPAAQLVTLAPGGTAHDLLYIDDAGNVPTSICHPATAAGLRVYAPGDYAPLGFPFSFPACARRGPIFMAVTPMVAGTGIPGDLR
jgi:hypothetical protein